ncbi:PREDICTED: uncharacterized protein LOC106790664 [Polistes canadensis]|uniref:uncharacterized protein LOC106790664 n=1 Tax=Polistes canadensis TaxID=91411 RepID=UPI000718ABE7|nr:PREDICTED: uncharacterized protein LOC106790664 [Polistes canadensis]
MTCLQEYSSGNGEGVAEAIGNWGFSNRTCNSGQELRRLKCLFAKMDCLRTTKPMTYVQYNRKYDPEAWHVKPSPEGCKPAWTFPENRPLITYNSVGDIVLVSTFNNVASDLAYKIPGRTYMLHGVSTHLNIMSYKYLLIFVNLFSRQTSGIEEIQIVVRNQVV